MTKQEIKALVAAKIAGQGTMVDAGGGLPTILDAIIDLIPEVPAPYVLPIASADTLGGVKVGENLSIDEDGKLSAYNLVKSLESLPTKAGQAIEITDEEKSALDKVCAISYDGTIYPAHSMEGTLSQSAASFFTEASIFYSLFGFPSFDDTGVLDRGYGYVVFLAEEKFYIGYIEV